MQSVGGGGSGLPVSGVGVLTGGPDVTTIDVKTSVGVIGISGSPIGWDGDTVGGSSESGSMGDCACVGVGVRVGVDVGLSVGLPVGLLVGCSGRFSSRSPGVAVAVAVGEGVCVTVGGVPSTVKVIALLATTV